MSFLNRLMINLRPATMVDAAKLYEMANDDDMRKARFGSAEDIMWIPHLDWLRDVIADPNRHLFMATVNNDVVGEIRFDVKDGEAEVGLVVLHDFRGLGYGWRMIDEGRKLVPARYYWARVGRDNVASINTFERAGFAHLKTVGDELLYTKHGRLR